MPLALAVFLIQLCILECRIFDVEFHHDTRQAVVVNTFGHTARGVLNLTVTQFELHMPKKIAMTNPYGFADDHNQEQNNIGFIYKRVTSDESAHHESYFRGLFIHKQNELNCFINLRASVKAIDADSIIIPVTPQQIDQPIIVKVPNNKKGLYGLFYYNCEQKKELVVVPVSMRFHVEQYNEQYVTPRSDGTFVRPGRDYLTVGESPLSMIYITMSACFLLLTILGTLYLIKEYVDIIYINILDERMRLKFTF
jgi:hypothetical protein